MSVRGIGILKYKLSINHIMDPIRKLIKSILSFFFSGLTEGVEGVMGGLEKKAKATAELVLKKITDSPRLFFRLRGLVIWLGGC